MPKPVSVLVLDDDRDFLSALGRSFSAEPYAVFTTTHPFEALAVLKRQAIKVVISDERMPVVSGTSFLKEVRETFPAVIRILLTGHSDLRSAEEAVNTGQVFAFFGKPCPPDVLIAAIRRGIEAYDQATREWWVAQSLRTEKPELISTLTGARTDLDRLASGSKGPLSPEQQGLVDRALEGVRKVLRFLESL